MRTVEQIIFLGAGASGAEGAPLQGDLLQKFFSRSWEEPRVNEIKTRLLDFFRTFFDEPDGPEELPTFEEVLGVIDIALQRNEDFRSYPNSPKHSALMLAREDLVTSIALTLDKELGPGPSRYHTALINRLAAEEKLLQTAFINLNYDIILDNVLVQAQRAYDIDVDYTLEFLNYKNLRNERDWARPRAKKSVLLLKPHGSLNWLACSACGGVLITPKDKGAARLATRRIDCTSCLSPTRAIIVPPTFYKDMHSFHLQHIWRQAELTFSQAKRLVFCGYSFPDADMHIKYLIKRSELTAGRLHEILVVNKRQGSPGPSVDVRRRYLRFFKRGKVNITNLSFQEFAERGLA